MLQFLHPIWLFAISGIIVPLVIHLWNIRQGKVLKVGSIAFFQNSSKQYAKSFKINDWLLLLLRCLLIILGSFLLAGPLWKQSQTNKEKGWLLTDKKGFTKGYNTYKPLIDSLITNGFTFHYFDENFTAKTLPEALKDTVLKTDNQPISYWNLIQKLDNKINASLPVYLITDNQLKHFTGDRPIIESNIRWLTYSLHDSMEKHIAKAYLINNDSIRLIIANSTPTYNSFLYENISAKIQSVNNYNTRTDNGKLTVQYNSDAAILVDTTTLKITVFAGQNNNDAVYLKAAINAIQTFTKLRIELSVVKDISSIPTTSDWLFWLSDQSLPKNITAKNVWLYAGGKEENTNSWINTLASKVGNNPIQLLKRTTPAMVSAASNIIWKDGFGNSILVKEINNHSTVYRFYSRFDPSWSNLVWENNFPALLTSIILNDDSIATFDDKRTIDERQIQPLIKASANIISAKIDADNTDITNIIWISIFIVFFMERLVSFRTKTSAI